MTQDLYYYESGYIDDSYFVYTADAESSVTSQATIDCSADKFKPFAANLESYTALVGQGELIQGGYVEASGSFGAYNSTIASVSKIASASSTMSSEFTQTATISNYRGADLFAFGEAQLQSQVQRVRETNTQASTYFDIATGYIRYRTLAVDASDAFTFSSQEKRIRASQVETQDAFLISATVGRIQGTSANLTSTGTLTVNISVSGTSSADIISTSTVSVSAQADKVAECYADDYFTQTAQATPVRTYLADLTSTASIAINAVKIVSVASNESSNTTQTTLANANYSPAISVEAQATLSSILSSIRGIDIVVNGFASLTAIANSDFQCRSTQTSSTSLVADNTRVKQFKTNLPYVSNDYVVPGYATEVPGVNGFANLTAIGETFVYVRGTGSISSQFSQTTTANYRVASTEAIVICQSGLSTSAGRIQRAQASIASAFSPDLTVDVFRNSFAVLDSVATVEAQVNKYNGARANITSQASTVVVGGTIKPLSSQQQFIISLNINPQLVAGGDSQLTAQTTVDATALRIQQSSVNLSSQTSLTTSGNRTQQAAASITSQAALTVTSSPIRDSIELLVSSGTVQAQPTVVRSAVIETQAIFSELVTGQTNTVGPQINIYVTTALACEPVAKLVGISIEASSGTLTLTPNIVKSTSVSTNSVASVQARVKRIAKANAQLQTTSILTVQAQKTTEIAIVVSGFAQLSCLGQTARLAIALVGSQATLTVTATLRRENNAQLTAQAQVQARVTYTTRPTIGLNTQTTLQAVIGAIHIDPYLTWKIPYENRQQSIRTETGIYKIGKDNRIHIVRREVRNYDIRTETRIHKIRR